MVHRSQILIITDRKRVFDEDTDMLTVLSLVPPQSLTLWKPVESMA